MHQPCYQDLATGENVLPWVRLHAINDYWGMVALLREFPSVKVTFNLVPSLQVQLDSFAREEARDRHLDIGLKPAEALTLSLIHISEPTRQAEISYAVFCLEKKKS